jgi:hypothetical protein
VNEAADPRDRDDRERPRSIDIDIEYLLSRLHTNHLHTRGHTMRLRPEAARWMGTSTNNNLRVSDAERNEVADRLSRHFSEGRLDETEFKDRLDAAMSAKTQGDLAGLFDDLPPLGTEPPPPPSRRRRLVPFALMLAFIVVVAGSTVPFLPFFHVPWLLIALVVAFFVWRRSGHHYHDGHQR